MTLLRVRDYAARRSQFRALRGNVEDVLEISSRMALAKSPPSYFLVSRPRSEKELKVIEIAISVFDGREFVRRMADHRNLFGMVFND